MSTNYKNGGPARRVRDFKPRPGALCPAGQPYQPGDKVVCVDESSTLLVDTGQEYEVHKVDGPLLVIYIDGSPEYMRASRFRRANGREL